MTDKELRRLSRIELLELLVGQVKENEALTAKVEQLTAQLEDRKVIFQESGSLAEAVLRINDVFTAADEAARQYLTNRIRQAEEQCAQMERETRERCSQVIKLVRQRAGQPEDPPDQPVPDQEGGGDAP